MERQSRADAQVAPLAGAACPEGHDRPNIHSGALAPPELVPGVDVRSIRRLRCGGPGHRWRAVGRVVGYRSLPLAYASMMPSPSIVISAGGWLVEIQFFGM